jgi:ABC-type methionine transport system ATPase subunit
MATPKKAKKVVAAKKTAKPRKKSSRKMTSSPKPGGTQQTRLWLMYPPKLITRPIIHEIVAKYKVIPNVRQASVTEEIGIVCLELAGERQQIKSAIKWMERLGISVEPVEINVIES